MITIASMIKKIAFSDSHWSDRIKDTFGISCHAKEDGALDPRILRQVYQILNLMPVNLVKDCKVKKLYLTNQLGPNHPKLPNHGFFMPSDSSITLNNDIFYHPDCPSDFKDSKGDKIDRLTETAIHEWGHALDESLGNISEKPEWLSLSGWSKEPRPGLKQLSIKEKGRPELVGEWFYDPRAGFTRFYGKRNPWDDWADSFSFFVYGMTEKLPDNKVRYFDKLLHKYYS